MKRWIQVMAAVAGGAAGSAAAALGAGTLLWNRSTARDVGRLAPRGPAGTFTRDQLAGLPAPVVRYFEFALPPGQPLIRIARLQHEGEFRGGFDKPWSPFKSVQHFSVEPPGFVWDAKIRMAPLLTVRVRDSYLQGSLRDEPAEATAKLRSYRRGVNPFVDHALIEIELAAANKAAYAQDYATSLKHLAEAETQLHDAKSNHVKSLHVFESLEADLLGLRKRLKV